jgi:VWFA-related protein
MKCLASFVLVLTLAAQDPQFDVQSRLVLVPANVTDAKGHTVDNLEPKDFVMLDNGRPQKVTVDTTATGVAPIALVVAIETAGISKAVLEKVRKIGAMIQPFVTGERGCAAVVSFSERVSWIQECTNSDDALARAFEQVHPGEAKSARMLDAIDESIQRLRQHANSRRVLLLISESRDRGSRASLDQIAVAAQTAGVTVYAATYSAFKTAWMSKSSATGEAQAPKVPKTPSEQTGTLSGGPPHCGPFGCPDPPVPLAEQRVDILGGIGELVRLGKTNTTQALAKGTGGVTFPFTRLKALQEAIQKLGAELQSQYLLSFMPEHGTSGYHTLDVRVTAGDFRVRARPGYWSTQPATQ